MIFANWRKLCLHLVVVKTVERALASLRVVRFHMIGEDDAGDLVDLVGLFLFGDHILLEERGVDLFLRVQDVEILGAVFLEELLEEGRTGQLAGSGGRLLNRLARLRLKILENVKLGIERLVHLLAINGSRCIVILQFTNRSFHLGHRNLHLGHVRGQCLEKGDDFGIDLAHA